MKMLYTTEIEFPDDGGYEENTTSPVMFGEMQVTGFFVQGHTLYMKISGTTGIPVTGFSGKPDAREFGTQDQVFPQDAKIVIYSYSA